MITSPTGCYQFTVRIWPEPWGEGTAHAIMSRARTMVANHPACLAGESVSFRYDGHRVFLKPMKEGELTLEA